MTAGKRIDSETLIVGGHMNGCEQKLADAKVKYGKPFLLEIRQSRKTGKSAFLRRLERLQKQMRADPAKQVELLSQWRRMQADAHGILA